MLIIIGLSIIQKTDIQEKNEYAGKQRMNRNPEGGLYLLGRMI